MVSIIIKEQVKSPFIFKTVFTRFSVDSIWWYFHQTYHLISPVISLKYDQFDTLYFGPSKYFWWNTNCFEQVQAIKICPESLIWTSPKQFLPIQNNLDNLILFWTCRRTRHESTEDDASIVSKMNGLWKIYFWMTFPLCFWREVWKCQVLRDLL